MPLKNISSRRRSLNSRAPKVAMRRSRCKLDIRRSTRRRPSRWRRLLHAANVTISWKGWATVVSFASLASLLTVWITFKSFGLNQEAQENERLSRAVAQLGSESAPERLAGIQTLQQISDKLPDKAQQINGILDAFVDSRRKEVASCGSLVGDLFAAMSVRWHYHLRSEGCRESRTVDNRAIPVFSFSTKDYSTLSTAIAVFVRQEGGDVSGSDVSVNWNGPAMLKLQCSVDPELGVRLSFNPIPKII